MKNQIKKLEKQIKNLHKNNSKKEIVAENQIDILDVAQYIINHQNKDDYTKMKLQKLVFFVYCKYLVEFQKPLFSNDFESWEYGPVSPKLYLKTLSYTSGFKKGDQIKENFNEDCFNSNQRKVMNHILRRYGNRTAWFLVKKTNKDKSPWDRCFITKDWSLNPIYDSTIIKYYSKKVNTI